MKNMDTLNFLKKILIQYIIKLNYGRHNIKYSLYIFFEC